MVDLISATFIMDIKTPPDLQIVMEMMIITLDNFSNPSVPAALTMAVQSFGDATDHEDGEMSILKLSHQFSFL